MPAALAHPRLTRRRALSGLLATIAAASSPWPARAEPSVLAFAAASMKNALEDAAAAWSLDAGAPVRMSFAGSAHLARQIEQGAPADLFLSANPDWMTYLDDRGAIASETRTILVSNDLVLIAHAPSADGAGRGEPGDIAASFDLASKLGDGRLAMAMTSATPAGIYGEAALRSLGLWDGVSGRLAEVDNVRAALVLVARGETPYGVVYASDALASDAVRVVGRFPAASHPPILYPGAVVAGSSAAKAAAAFLSYLRSDAGLAHFLRWGFSRPPSERS